MTDTERAAPAAGVGPTVKLLAVLAALPLAWGAVRHAVQNQYAVSNPGLAMAAWPADGRSLAAASRRAIVAADGQVDAAARGLYESALRREPMLAEPITMAGLDASAEGDLDRAERLMRAARQRDPRSAIARFWLFDHYMRTGRFAEGIDEVSAAIRMRPETQKAVLTVLSALVELPEGRAALRDRLAQAPYWREAFFQTAAETNPVPANTLALLQELPRNPDRDRAREEQRAVLMALVAKRQYDLAYRAWREMLPPTYAARATTVYDGNFAGWPGPMPFNWNLFDDANGVARPIKSADLATASALHVRYFGSNPALLAEQYVLASPGAWQLSLQARRRTRNATGGRLSMTVHCAATMDTLATLPLDGLTAQMRGYAVAVPVPAGCTALRLRLNGTPGDVFSEQEAQVTNVALSRA